MIKIYNLVFVIIAFGCLNISMVANAEEKKDDCQNLEKTFYQPVAYKQNYPGPEMCYCKSSIGLSDFLCQQHPRLDQQYRNIRDYGSEAMFIGAPDNLKAGALRVSARKPAEIARDAGQAAVSDIETYCEPAISNAEKTCVYNAESLKKRKESLAAVAEEIDKQFSAAQTDREKQSLLEQKHEISRQTLRVEQQQKTLNSEWQKFRAKYQSIASEKDLFGKGSADAQATLGGISTPVVSARPPKIGLSQKEVEDAKKRLNKIREETCSGQVSSPGLYSVGGPSSGTSLCTK